MRQDPNPVGGQPAVVPLHLKGTASVRVAAYDVLGREVALMYEGAVPAGTSTFAFEPHGLPPGIYVMRAESDGFTLTRRVTLLR